MVTAKSAQLLLASIYRAGGSAGRGRRVTQSLGQLGRRDGEAAWTPRGCAKAQPAAVVPAARSLGGRAQEDSLPSAALGSHDMGRRAGAVEKKWGVPWIRPSS